MRAWSSPTSKAPARALDLAPERVVIWIESSAHELVERYMASSLQNRPTRPWLSRSRELWDLIISRLKDRGFVVVDPRERIENHFLDGGEYPFSASGHYRPIAYRLTAPPIAHELSKMIATH